MQDLFTGNLVDNGGEVSADTETSLESVEQAAPELFSDDAEVAPEVAAVIEEPKEDKFALKFAALSRKEKQLRDQERELKNKMSEMDLRLRQFDERSKPVEAPKPAELPLEYRLKQNPMKTLEELGIPFNKLTDIALNDGKLPMEMQLELMRRDLDEKHSKELQALKSELLEDKKSREQEKFNQTINGFMREITDTVNSNEKYELIQANSAVQLVYDVIEAHYNDTKNVLPIDEAAEHVENYLFEESKKLLNMKKLQSLFNTPQASSKPVESRSQAVSKPTLSNALSAISQTKQPKQFLSDDESKKLAASLIKWED